MSKSYILDSLIGLAHQCKDDTYAQALEMMWGDKSEDDERAKKLSRSERRNMALKEKNRLRSWLNHDELTYWDHQFRKRNPKSFASFLVREDSQDKSISVRDILKRYEMSFGYPHYQRASSIIHGSFVAPFVGEVGVDFATSLLGSSRDLEAEASHTRRFSHNNSIRLLQMRDVIDAYVIHLGGDSGS